MKNNTTCEDWQDEIIKNNPNDIFHTLECENNNPLCEEDSIKIFENALV